jgi:hypothetical protein
MRRSGPLSPFFTRKSLCLICSRDTAQALVSPTLSSCIFSTFSNNPDLLLINTIVAAIANAATVTAVVLTTIAAITAAIAAVAMILTFNITITAAAAVVTAVIIVVAATAVVAHVQHVVRAKPPNRQTQPPVA